MQVSQVSSPPGSKRPISSASVEVLDPPSPPVPCPTEAKRRGVQTGAQGQDFFTGKGHLYPLPEPGRQFLLGKVSDHRASGRHGVVDEKRQHRPCV